MSQCRSRSRRRVAVCAVLLWTIGWLGPTAAGAQGAEPERLRLHGDFRARLESDFDSERADGSEREDRARLRIRARLKLEYTPSDRLSFGLRVRTGADGSQQSPHLTVIDFDDNDRGDAAINADQWYLRRKSEKSWLWIGRNSLPLWKQNELLWDDDVTPAGLALGIKGKWREARLSVAAGYFALPVGMRNFAGRLALAQGVLEIQRFKASVAIFDIDAEPDDSDAARLLRGNGSRDYRLIALGGQIRLGRWTLGLDWMHNAESYPIDDPLRGATDGVAGSLKWAPGDTWWLRYTYADIEAYAVHSSYAQDDWVRWGSAEQTRASDLKGHELHWRKILSPNQNIDIRLFSAESITTVEDGNRLRIDYNYRF